MTRSYLRLEPLLHSLSSAFLIFFRSRSFPLRGSRKEVGYFSMGNGNDLMQAICQDEIPRYLRQFLANGR